MMDMTSGMHIGFILLGGVHFLAGLAIAAGLIFCILWAAKRLSEAQLKRWGLILLAIGIVAGVATAALGAFGIKNWKEDRGMMKKKMDMMEMRDQGSGSAHEEHKAMTMDDMVGVLQGKTGDDFDRAFLEGMIEHHEGAIDMAKLAQSAAGHQEIKDMAEDIISAQNAEVETMQEWMQDWGYSAEE